MTTEALGRGADLSTVHAGGGVTPAGIEAMLETRGGYIALILRVLGSVQETAAVIVYTGHRGDGGL